MGYKVELCRKVYKLKEDIKKQLANLLVNSQVKVPSSDKAWFYTKLVNIRGKVWVFTRNSEAKKWKKWYRVQ
jgi:hypothetical protein